MDERTLRIFWALCPGLEAATLRTFFSAFGTMKHFHAADETAWRQAVRVRPTTVENMRRWREQVEQKAPYLEAALNKSGIACLVLGDEHYPVPLLDLASPPIVLFARGDTSLLHDSYIVSMVGTRRASSYGLEAARWISTSLSQAGMAICSGMALGIDQQVHQAALAADGRCIAILGCGVDVCYPPSNRRLYTHLLTKGLVVSEYQPRSLAAKHRFPERNRLIAGLALATVVIQAGEKSGAIITAESALNLGRDVYVVPGPITSKSFRGSHLLLNDGAAPVVDPDMFARQLSNGPLVARTSAGPEIAEHLQTLVRYLSEEGPLRAGELAQIASMPPGHVYASLLELEIGGIVERHFDGCYQLKLALEKES
jgi:DNA processing protein